MSCIVYCVQCIVYSIQCIMALSNKLFDIILVVHIESWTALGGGLLGSPVFFASFFRILLSLLDRRKTGPRRPGARTLLQIASPQTKNNET